MSRLHLLALCGAALVAGCNLADPPRPRPDIPFTPDRPQLPSGGLVPVYTGSDPFVQEAQTRFLTGLDLHQKVVVRSCGGTNGVCHNAKEYPDLHTAANFTRIIDAPCNVQAGSWEGIFDRCERVGDRFTLDASGFTESEIAWLQLIPGPPPTGTSAAISETTPGLHVYLQEPLPTQVEVGRQRASFLRSFLEPDGTVRAFAYGNYSSDWWVLPDRRHLVARVDSDQLERVQALLTAGVVEGDPNRNGVFGARTGRAVSLITPGWPEQSYLVARLRGQMEGDPVPGTRMPLANQPPSIIEMLALMCFIEGLDPAADSWNLGAGIDYVNCSYSADPAALNLVGTGATWSGRIRPLLEASCGGCHGGATPSGGFDVLADGLYARLFQPSSQQPARNLIVAGQPEQSYLWLKLVGDGSITGDRMPVDPVTGNGELPAADLEAIQTWITAGALDDA